jgi:hypothetical protein
VREKTTLRKFRWFWPWQDEREEAWLGSLSREGWHLSSFGFPGVYFFQKGVPKNFVYRLDYQSSQMKDRQVYLQLFRDAGWEHAGKMSAWEYFRKETRPGEEPEIFTDPESKIRKYNLVIASLIVFLPVLLLLFSPLNSDHGPKAMVFGLQCFAAGIMACIVLGILGIVRRINQLK